MALHKKAKIYTAFSAANGIVFGMNALYYCFIQLYLEKSCTPVESGYLLSAGALAAAIFPMLWSKITDKAKYKNTALLVAVAVSGVIYPLFTAASGFYYYLVLIIILMLFMSPFNALIDAVTMEYSSEHKLPYGFFRVAGTLLYGLAAFAVTLFSSDNYNAVFIMFSAMALLYCCISFFIPKVKGHAEKKEKLSLKPLLKNRRLMLYFLIIAVSQFSFGFYLNFFPTYMINELQLPQWVWGANVFLTVIGEVPFFLMFGGIYKKFGEEKVLTLGITLSLIRSAVFAVAGSPLPILLNALVTGPSPTILMYSAARYINENVDEKLKASGQLLMHSAAIGLPKVLSGFTGGYIVSFAGTRAGMIFCAAMNIVACAIYFALKRKNNKIK